METTTTENRVASHAEERKRFLVMLVGVQVVLYVYLTR
jgi:hypothetical protein